MEWISTSMRKLICSESGHWEGLRSELVLVMCSDGNKYIGRACEGIMDGSEFFYWYDQFDYSFVNTVITHWHILP